MVVEDRTPIDDLYTIDAGFLNHRAHVAVYLLNAEKPVLIDTAASTCVRTLLKAFSNLPVGPAELDYVLLSHLHLDHAGGAGYLLEALENATVLVHPEGLPFLNDPEKIDRLLGSARRALGELAEGYGDLKPIPGDRLRAVSPGEVIDLGDRELYVLEASGHAPHQIALHEPDAGFLYTGDEAGLWLGGTDVPATPPPNFDLERNLASLERFRTRDLEYLVYPHYGIRKGALRGLDSYEATLREWVETVAGVKHRHDDAEAVVHELLRDNEFYPELWDNTSREQIIRTDTMGVLRYLDNRE